jgi:AcrR family transcriptional regulator
MLEVAERLMAERGYHAVSVDELAAEVGVSKPMVYAYFGSKEGLLVGAIRRARTGLLEAIVHAVDGLTDPEEVLRRGLLAAFEFIDQHNAAWRMLRQELNLNQGPAAEEFEAIRQQQTEFNAVLISSLVDSRLQLSPLELEAYGEIIVGACERLAVWRDRHPEVTAEEASGHVMALIWPGLAALQDREDR